VLVRSQFLVMTHLACPRLTSASPAFDAQNLILYVSMHQVFSLAVIPFHRADVALTTVLHLTTKKSSVISDPSSPLMSYSETLPPTKESQHLLYAQPTIFLIAKQEDFYQPAEFVKFLPGGGILHLVISLLQYWATFLCLLGAVVGYPVTAYLEWRDGDKKMAGS
jgi:hypothetical protein